MLRAANNTIGGIITDPFVYAWNVYGGSWVSNNYINKWEGYANFATTSMFSGHVNPCAPVAITNMIKMYGKRYGHSQIVYDSVTTVFNKVLQANNNHGGNYYKTYLGFTGSFAETSGLFASLAFEEYGVMIGTSNINYIDYSRTRNTLEGNSTNNLMLMTLSTRNTNPYGDHAVVGYAYTRLRCTTATDMYRAFIKVSDGWYSSGRYLEIDSIPNGRYFEIRCK